MVTENKNQSRLTDAEFETIRRENEAWVQAACRKYERDGGDALSLANEVFLEYYLRGEPGADPRSVRAYLKKLVGSRGVDHCRKATRSVPRANLDLSAELVPDARGGPEAEVLGQRTRDELRQALASLPIEYRVALGTRCILGYTREQVARASGLSISQIRLLERKGAAQLREILKDRGIP
ncbi:MAG: RNA polymerase sigma factor [Armatimonadetes bacterium]|nr:RNA polymerase sigma factor [Armatimonadota bacterium]